MSTLLRAGAFTLMVVFAFAAIPVTIGEIADDPGGWPAAGLIAVLLVPLAALTVQAARRPATAGRGLAVAVGLLAVYAIVDAFVPAEERVPPVVAIGSIMLAVPLGVLGLRRAGEAGALMLIEGLLPLTSLVLVAVRNADEGDVLHLSGSPAAAGMPAFFVGALFLLAWGVGDRHA